MKARVVIEALPPLAPGDYSRHAYDRDLDRQLYVTHEGLRTEQLDRQVARREAHRRRTADIPFWTAPRGYCRWCGQDMGELRRNPTRRWHPGCADAYNAIASQGALRAAVWARDKGVCVDCPPGTPTLASARRQPLQLRRDRRPLQLRLPDRRTGPGRAQPRPGVPQGLPRQMASLRATPARWLGSRPRRRGR